MYVQNPGIRRLHPNCMSRQPWILMNNHKPFLILQELRLMVMPGLPKPKSNKISVSVRFAISRNSPRLWSPKLLIRKCEPVGETMEYPKVTRSMWLAIALRANWKSNERETMKKISETLADLTQPCFRFSPALKKW